MFINRRLFVVGLCLVFLVVFFCSQVGFAQFEGVGSVTSELGQEMRQMEEDVIASDKLPPAKTPDVVVEESEKPVVEETTVDYEETYAITNLDLTGDVEILDLTGLRYKLEREIVGETLDYDQIMGIAEKYQDELVKDGYYLALISTPITDYSLGTVAYDIDMGRFGRTRLYPDGEAPLGRYFTEKQLRRKLADLSEGGVFDYDVFYRSVFDVNSHPDIVMDTRLRIRTEDGDDDRKSRYADMDFIVSEELPLHAMLELNNSGTEATKEWRAGLTVQHLNLTKHDDVLTLKVLASPEFKAMRSGAGSYRVPYYLGNGGAFTLYGGYSDIDSDEIAAEINVEGSGWFGGLQGSYNLIVNSRHLLSGSLGLVHRYIEDRLVLGDIPSRKREATIDPLSLSFSYSSARPDFLGGRNYVTSETSYNLGKILGGSDNEEIDDQRLDAKSDYYIERIQLARIQPLFGRLDDEGRKVAQWILFTKADGQFASGPLIPAEQKAAGGANSVRGYPEREALGDHGVTGTIELRTPLLSNILTRPFSRGESSSEDSFLTDRLQFILFSDGGYVERDKVLQGEKKSESLVSVGLGLRLSIADRGQLRVDGGYRLKATEDSKEGVRVHVAVLFQI